MCEGLEREGQRQRANGDSHELRPFEDEIDFSEDQQSSKETDDLGANRTDVIAKVLKSLEADAQRGENELLRSDVDRAYLRKQLSIPECMAVEEGLLEAGYRIVDDTFQEIELGTDSGSRHQTHYLTENEEKELGRKIQLALRLPDDRSELNPAFVERVLNEAEKAQAAFVVSNLRFVEHVARRFGEHEHLCLEDVIQEGILGLMHAAERYDPERGFRFKTYATWWIEQHIRRAIANLERTVRLPVHVQEKMGQIKRAKKKLAFSLGHPPTLDELATAVGMEPERLIKFLWQVEITNCADGDTMIGEDETLFSLQPAQQETVVDIIARQELQENLRRLLSTLKPKEAQIIRMRFGIDVDQEHTLESLGKKYGLTRERIRQVEAIALKKLRHPSRRDSLADFLNS